MMYMCYVHDILYILAEKEDTTFHSENNTLGFEGI